MTLLRRVAVMVGLALTSSVCLSAEVARFDIQNAAGPVADSSGIANVSVSAFSAAAGLAFVDLQAGFHSFFPWPDGAARDANVYFEFTLKPDAGYKVIFGAVDKLMCTIMTHTDLAASYEVRYSTDNFATVDNLLDSGGFGGAFGSQVLNIDVSGLGTVLDSTTVTFRFYFYDLEVVPDATGFEGSNGAGQPITLSGTVAVTADPTPGVPDPAPVVAEEDDDEPPHPVTGNSTQYFQTWRNRIDQLIQERISQQP